MKWIIALVAIWLVWKYLRPAPKRRPVDDRAQARALLGVSASASDDEIRAAHRRLVADVHPDRGGSAEQARQVNAARDMLLRRA